MNIFVIIKKISFFTLGIHRNSYFDKHIIRFISTQQTAPVGVRPPRGALGRAITLQIHY